MGRNKKLVVAYGFTVILIFFIVLLKSNAHQPEAIDTKSFEPAKKQRQIVATQSVAKKMDVSNLTVKAMKPIEKSEPISVDKVESRSCCPKKVDPCLDIPCGYNRDARVEVCGNIDMSISGSYIYWNVKENHLAVGEDNFQDVSIVTRDDIKFDFDTKSGFKVGVGFGFNYDNWELFADYTRIHGSTSRDYLAAINHNIVPHWIITNANDITSLQSSWKYEYDMLTFSLIKSYYTSHKFYIAQSIGLKGGWLNQSVNASYFSTITRSASPRSKSWLLGPRYMINSSWILGRGFEIFADLGICLFYQKFTTIATTQIDPALAPATREFKDNDYKQVKPNMELMAGLKWGDYFSNNRFYLSLLVGYELQHYWTQNMIRDLISRNINPNSFVAGVQVNGDFMLHGLTTTLKITF